MRRNINESGKGYDNMALVAEADLEAEEGEDDMNNKCSKQNQKRQRRVASLYNDSLSPEQNDVSCFLDLLAGDNSNGEVDELLPSSNIEIQQ